MKLVVAAALCAACAPVMHQARLSDGEPASERESQARETLRAHPDCASRFGVLLPGYLQLCRGRTAEGAVLAGLGVAELGSAIAGSAADGLSSNAAGIPLLALGDLLTLSVMDAALESQRALKLKYVPQENLSELAQAPFSGEVLKRPAVWGGILGTLALGLVVSRIVDGPITTQGFGKRPVLFGRSVNSAVGYPAAAAIGVGVFEHVSLAEESTFRGLLQSSWSRKYGEDRGFLYASLAFGALHAGNILFMDSSARLNYLAAGVPFITVLGSYLGFVYRSSGYSLAPSVAIHFWYDFLVEAIAFAGDPKSSPLALSWETPF
jgi:membrane protease YdiL (CAAX protease family)